MRTFICILALLAACCTAREKHTYNTIDQQGATWSTQDTIIALPNAIILASEGARDTFEGRWQMSEDTALFTEVADLPLTAIIASDACTFIWYDGMITKLYNR